MNLIKKIAGILLALLLMATAWDDCAEIPGESQYDDKTLTKFSDVTKEHRLYNGIRIAEIEGWFAGYPDGTLKPDQVITANQIAAVVQRLYPDGATRAEVANFLAAGSIGVIQKNLVLETNETDQTVRIVNVGSFAVDLDDYELSWSRDDGEDFVHMLEDIVVGPGEGYTVEAGEPIGTSINLNNRYALSVVDTSVVSM